MTSSIGIILIISVFAIKCVCCSTSYRVISINETNIQCYFEYDVKFMWFEYTYKENVGSIEDCCNFCIQNARCIVWSLEFGRCSIKSKRGPKISAPGAVAGFSPSYYATMITPIQDSTTNTRPTTLTKFTRLSSRDRPFTNRRENTTPFKGCSTVNYFYYSGPTNGIAYNIDSSQSCCDICHSYPLCKQYSYFGFNQTCFLFNYIGLNKAECPSSYSCSSSLSLELTTSTPNQSMKQQNTTNTIDTELKDLYLGCFLDKSKSRDLNFTQNIPLKSVNMTIGWCLTQCRYMDMKFAGLQYSDECWCGLTYGYYGKLQDEECNYPCAGNNTQICGGVGKNSIYRVNTIELPTIVNVTLSDTSNFITETSNEFSNDYDYIFGFPPLVTTTKRALTGPIADYDDFIKIPSTTTPKFLLKLGNTPPKIKNFLSTLKTETHVTNTESINVSLFTTEYINTTSFMNTTNLITTTSIPETSLISTNSVIVITNAPLDVNTTNVLPNTTVTNNNTTLVITEIINSTIFSTTNFTHIPSTTVSIFANTTMNVTQEPQIEITTVSSTVLFDNTTVDTLSNISTTEISSLITTQPITVNTNENILNDTFYFNTTTQYISTTSNISTENELISPVTLEASNQTLKSLVQFASTPLTTLPVTSSVMSTTASSTINIITPSITTFKPTIETTLLSITTVASTLRTPNFQNTNTRNSIITIVLAPILYNFTSQIGDNTNISRGLRDAFLSAERRVLNVLSSMNSGSLTSQKSVQVIVNNIISLNKLNSDNTKLQIQINYIIIRDNQELSADYVSDILNLLTKQDLYSFLGLEIVDNGFAEGNPRKVPVESDNLWIIGAVIGPLAGIFILVWITGYVYYKCISPVRADDKSLLDKSNNTSKNDDSIQQSKQQKSSKKIEPLMPKQEIEVSSRPPPSFKTTELVQLPPINLKKSVEIETDKEYNLRETSYKVSRDVEIQKSIRQKSEIEKWRNKQRKREKILESQLNDESSYEKTQTSASTETRKIEETKRRMSELLDETFKNIQQQNSTTSSSSSRRRKRGSTRKSTPTTKLHTPLKIDTQNQPSKRDISRVHNPYEFQDEYAQYFHAGLLNSNSNHKTSTSLSSNQFLSDTTKTNLATSTDNESFSFKVKGNRDTEFQNLNNLKQFSKIHNRSSDSQIQSKPTSANTTSSTTGLIKKSVQKNIKLENNDSDSSNIQLKPIKVVQSIGDEINRLKNDLSSDA